MPLSPTPSASASLRGPDALFRDRTPVRAPSADDLAGRVSIPGGLARAVDLAETPAFGVDREGP